jgi:hypothetical protein
LRKYQNKPTNGFASKREAHRYSELLLLERAGHIKSLELQPKYEFVINGVKVTTYKADFRYVEKGATVVEDAKGYRTQVYRLKVKLMKALHNIDIKEV